jgi:lysophospholipase L1-like esterase
VKLTAASKEITIGVSILPVHDFHRQQPLVPLYIYRKMRILFFGDSLTRGQVGASFVDLLSTHYPDADFINKGTNGDTLDQISEKLLTHLQQTNNYDYIVLQGGGNDILLPFFNIRGGLFRFAYNSQIKKGLRPVPDSMAYYKALVELFKNIRLVYKGKVIFITMTYLNEKPDTELNRQRLAFNSMARKAALQESMIVADIEPLFNEYLKDKVQTDYLIESFWAVTITDRIFSLFKKGIDHLSKHRRLLLTIDGAHLNNTGASMICDTLRQIIGDKKGPGSKL